MTVESLQVLSGISYVVAGILCLCDVVLFFKCDIGKILGNLSGIAVEKEIQSIYKKNQRGEDGISEWFEMQESEEKETAVLTVISETTVLDESYADDFFLEKELGFLGSFERLE